MLPRVLRRGLASPLVRFLLFGGSLWALAGRVADPKEVDLDPAALRAVLEAQAKKLAVAELPPEGRREVEARAIEDEVLYREALRLGLDRDDPIVRQRLVQKLLLLVEDLGGASTSPSREELAAWFAGRRDHYRRPARYRFVHVFARSEATLPDASVLAGRTEPPDAGEAFPWPRLATSTREEIARAYGEGFAAAVASLEPGAVSAPLRSSYGLHRVRVLDRIEGRPAELADVEQEVLLDFLLARREAIVGKYLTATVASYDVRIGGRPVEGFVPTRRVAARVEGSAED